MSQPARQKARDVLAAVAAKRRAKLKPAHILPRRPVGADFRIGGYLIWWEANDSHYYIDMATPKITAGFGVNHGEPYAPVLWGKISSMQVRLPEESDDEYPDWVPDAKRWLDDPANRAAVESLDLEHDEWLIMLPGHTLAQLKCTTADRDERRVELLTELADRLTDPTTRWARWARPERVPMAQVPETLRPLTKLLHKWAEADDSFRGLTISKARASTLTKLVAVVQPRLADVDALLDSFDGDPPEWATRFGTVAEAAIEARHELERRGRLIEEPGKK